MGATFTVNNGTVDVNFIWPGIVTAKATEIVENAALYDWQRGLGPTIVIDDETAQKPWEGLSNQEKLDMVFAAAQRLIVAQSKTAYITGNLDDTRETATAYADANLDLE